MAMRTKVSTEVLNALKIAVGIFIGALAYRMYLIPNDIAPGGFTGIAQILNHVLPGISIGSLVLILNVPLFAFSMKAMGFRFGVRSLIASIGLSLLLDYLPIPPVTDDVLLSTVFGGVFSGIGFGLVLRGSATTGGSDMLASILHKRFPALKINVGLFAVDAMVIAASGFVFDPSAAMYALICAFVLNVVLDFVLEGPGLARSHLIISTRGDEIAERIIKELGRGVTSLDAKGMYSGQDRTVLLCVVNRLETIRLRNIVFSVDPKAFMIANNAHEVLGEGFKMHGK